MLQSSVNLRYYQDDAVNVFTVGGCKNGIIVCPTGAGKSIVISELAKRLNDTNVLVLQPSKEILEQNFTKYSAYSNDASIYSASLNKRELNRVTFATIGSVIKLPNSILREFKVIVVDECHLVGQYGQYAELINIIKPDILIGLTATPYRNNSKFGGIKYEMLTRKMDCIFETISYKYEIQDCIKDGFWCNIKYFTPIKYDTKNLETRGSEFKDEAVAQYNFSINLHENIIGIVNNSNKKHFLVFLTTISECEHTEKILIQAGISCRAIHSKLHKKERDDILNKFKSGEIKVVLNVGVLTTGFDFPELDCLILARPTMSLSLYYQMCLSLDTEILTKRGFVAYNEITQDDIIYGFDITSNEIKETYIQKIIVREKFDFESIYNYESSRLNLSVSEYHDMICSYNPHKIWHKKTLREAFGYKDLWYIPVAGFEIPKATNILNNDEVRLLGWFLSDGSKNKHGVITITQSLKNIQYVNEIQAILDRLNIGYTKTINKRTGADAKYCDNVMFVFCKTTKKEGKIGYQYIQEFFDKNMNEHYDTFNREQVKILLDTINKGDGCNKTTTKYKVKTIKIACGSNKIYTDRLQSLIIRRGFKANQAVSIPCNKNKQTVNQYFLYITDIYYSSIAGSNTKNGIICGKGAYKRTHFVKDDKQNKLWCITNPMGTIITRRNGKVAIVGNCGRGVRTHKGKECCDIYDLCGNVESFGRIETLQFVGDNYKRLGLISDKRVLIAPPKSYMNAKMMNAEKFEDIGLVVLQNGKYAGTTIQEVWDMNKGYVQFCIDNNTSFKPIFEKFLLQQQKIAQLLR